MEGFRAGSVLIFFGVEYNFFVGSRVIWRCCCDLGERWGGLVLGSYSGDWRE